MIRRRRPLARSRKRIARSPLRRPRATPRRALKALADKLCGAIVRARGKCERCGKREMLQWAHGFSRRYLGVRWDFRNGFCLCRGCHFYFGMRPIEWEVFMLAKLGQVEYDQLRARALMVGRVDLAAVVLMLQRESA